MGNSKEIIFEEEARRKLVAGIIKATDAIACTLGPKGRNVGLQKSWGAPTIINDGNTIVKDIELPDQYENMGAAMVKEVAAKLKEKCGDGTTTSSLLLRALVETGIKYIASGASPISLKRGLEKGQEALLKQIDSMVHPIKNVEETLSIATVSASGNTEIGQFISDALQKVGKSGVVTIEEGKGTETSVEMVEGMQFDRGYISAYFCTNNENMTVEMENAAILITDKKIGSIQELLPLLQSCLTTGKALLVIADDIDGDALATLVVNKLRGTLRIAAVKAPGFGDRRKAMLQDIAVLTGATLITDEVGIALKDATADMLGTCEKISITKDSTTLISGAGTKEEIEARIKQIQGELNNSTNKYDKEKLEERKAKLSGGVAVIRVGAPTEPEMKQKKQMFQDSLNSTKAALEEGIVYGGGLTLLRASDALKQMKLEGDENLGIQLLIKACEMPIRQIITNAGLEASVILSQIQEKKGSFGFNAVSEKVEDVMVANVIDAAKVVKNCIISAISVAGIVLISEALIGDAEDDSE
ncbi:MAG: chaperonin GroEL [Parachlamydiales bacterium]|nr:chaperonin GroEL [Parachlamydiales bacterium]